MAAEIEVAQNNSSLPQQDCKLKDSLGSSAVLSGPFKATQLWNDIIWNLKRHVLVKRRRVRMRHYDRCFTGADCVDVVFRHLLKDSINFTKNVSRDKAVKLCKLLMEYNIFEAVARSSEDNGIFEDNSSKFYRFLENTTYENTLPGRCDECDDCEISPSKDSKASSSLTSCESGVELSGSSDGIISNPVVITKHGQIVQEIMDITGAWKRYSIESLHKTSPPRKLFKRPSLPASLSWSSKKAAKPINVPPAVEDEILHEVALGKLLQIVDLPFLDGILSYENTSSSCPDAANKMVFTNAAFNRNCSSTSIFSECYEEDEWTETALDCLEFCPKGLSTLEQTAVTHDNTELHKIKLFQTLTDYYCHLAAPLWPDSFTDLHVAILNLIMQGRNDRAVEALRLSHALLPRPVREELFCLLRFMRVAAEDHHGVTLDTIKTNKETIQEMLCPCVIRNKVLSPLQAAFLVMFMVDNLDFIYEIPDDVSEMVHARIEQLTTGMPQVMIETTFCNRVSEEEFRRQQKECTENALSDLMNRILDDTKIPLKDKKHKLKQLQKQHSQVYYKHFAGLS